MRCHKVVMRCHAEAFLTESEIEEGPGRPMIRHFHWPAWSLFSARECEKIVAIRYEEKYIWSQMPRWGR
jgi:hypothetical protein